jgi:Lytic transglycolase
VGWRLCSAIRLVAATNSAARQPATAREPLDNNPEMPGPLQTIRPTSVALLALLGALALADGCGTAENVPIPQRPAPAGRADSRDAPGSAPNSSSSVVRPPPATQPAPSPSTARPAATQPAPSNPRPVPPAHPVPVAFRPAPGAPSDAEVRSELGQLSAIKRQQREQKLSPAPTDLAGLLPWSLEPKSGTQVSVASVFSDYGLGLACGGVLGRDELGVAHKTAPCGTLITFTYAGRSLTVPVIDRGPYVAGREWDLTGATAAALGFPGLGPIEWSLAS